MAKLGCICGNVITDQTDNISYKASFIRDQNTEDYYSFTDQIASFLEAVKNESRDEWIVNYFGKGYPTDINLVYYF